MSTRSRLRHVGRPRPAPATVFRSRRAVGSDTGGAGQWDSRSYALDYDDIGLGADTSGVAILPASSR